MDLDIRDLRVLVTAAASGIGLATARAFAREGARVHVCDVDAGALEALRTTDRAFSFSVCDVADQAAVAAMFESVASAMGGLDALVNNAGVAGPTAACENVGLRDWERTLAVNLTGTFLCARQAIPMLKQSANGSMTNLSSAAGRFGFPNRAAYAASKWGVIGLSKSLSMELGPAGVRVNAICPGLVEGGRIDAVIDSKAKLRGVPPDAVRDELLGRSSLRQMVGADDIADMILFLASRRGANVSGQALAIDADLQSLV